MGLQCLSVLKYLSDENFHNHVIRGFRRQFPKLDLVRAVEVGLEGATDPAVLEWAAQNDRILITHDVRTIRAFVEDRLAKGLAMPGVIFVPQPFSRSQVIEDLGMIAECYEADELALSWLHLPLR